MKSKIIASVLVLALMIVMPLLVACNQSADDSSPDDTTNGTVVDDSDDADDADDTDDTDVDDTDVDDSDDADDTDGDDTDVDDTDDADDTDDTGGIPGGIPVGHSAAACAACHETGVAGAPQWPDDHADRADDGCSLCHQQAE